MSVASNMGEWHHFARLRKWPKSDAAVFRTAFVLTVVIDLAVAVEFGLLLAAFMFIKRMADQTKVDATFELSEEEAKSQSQTGREVPKGVMIYRLFGAFFFGAADKLETALMSARQLPEVLILRLREVVAIDATGINALEDMHEKLKKKGKHLILCGPHTQPLFALDNGASSTPWAATTSALTRSPRSRGRRSCSRNKPRRSCPPLAAQRRRLW